LGAKDPAKVEQTMTTLVAKSAQTIPFLKKQLHPVLAPEPRRVADLLASLDSDDFAIREEAHQELGNLCEGIEADLKKAMKKNNSEEVRRRIEGLLKNIRGERLSPSSERLRAVRAIEVLERIDNGPARAILATLAAGATEAQLTVEAKTALERLTTASQSER